MRALKILIVDDDSDNAKSLGELFEFEGHEAHVVSSGAQAINRYLREDFDVGFVDVIMPGMNGIESFMQIRKLKPKSKVFMMSGYSFEELLKQAISQGSMSLLTQELDQHSLRSIFSDIRSNSLVVTPFLPQLKIDFLREAALQRGLVCRIADTPAAIERGGLSGDLLVLNLDVPIVDALGLYSTLRKAHDMPPTVLAAPRSSHIRPDDALRDMHVTGILNKPFDLDIVLSHVRQLAA